MRKSIYLIGLFVVLPFVALALDDKAPAKSKEKPACLTTETVRVEIGGERFAFPRKAIVSMRGESVIDIRGEKWNGSAPGSRACQNETDDVWALSLLALYLHPTACNDNKSCNITKISARIQALDTRRNVTSIPQTPEELIKQCKPPSEPWSDFHKKYWSSCKYAFAHKQLHIYMKFKGGHYAPENIEKTKQLALDSLYKHKIQ